MFGSYIDLILAISFSALTRLINIEEGATMICYLMTENGKSLTGLIITLDAWSTV